jgi:hypothetical protein
MCNENCEMRNAKCLRLYALFATDHGLRTRSVRLQRSRLLMPSAQRLVPRCFLPGACFLLNPQSAIRNLSSTL